MSSTKKFPIDTYCSQICRLLDAIDYNDTNLTKPERQEALQIVHTALHAYFHRAPAQRIFQTINQHRLFAVTRTISQFVVSCWSKVPRASQIDIAIFLAIANILDDTYNRDPGEQMRTFWHDLFSGKEQTNQFWVLMNDHLPKLLSHYGPFCGYNIVRCTFDFFQGYWMEQRNFAGFEGAECYPLFVRRLNSLGGAVGAMLFPAAEFDEQECFNELASVMAQISGPETFLNDLLSYYKEFEREEVNLITSWCVVDSIGKEEALERLTEETIRACRQILDVFEGRDPKIFESIRAFLHGYVTWHIFDPRYRLSEVYERAERTGHAERLRAYFDKAFAVGWIDPAEWADVPENYVADDVSCMAFD